MNERGRALWRPQADMGRPLEDRIIVERGEGAYLVTADGRRVLDAVASLWHANVGHGRHSIADAMAAQVRRLETYHLAGRYANDAALDLADRLARLAPMEDTRIFFTSGGSDAVELACKLALRHWQEEGRADKRVVVSRANGYHGLHAFGTSITGLESNRTGYGTESLVPDTARIAHSDLDSARRAIGEIGPERIAAIVAEPVMGTGGVIPPAPGYLEGLQAICREHDILFVVDEVITGFGRVGEWFATTRFRLEPDLLLFAKGVTSGYAPLGGVMVAPRVWERFFAAPGGPVFRHGITYSGHATACAAAEANLDILEQEGLLARARALEGVMADALVPLAAHEVVREVRAGVGALAGIQLHSGVDGEAIAQRCLDEGVAVRVIADNTIQVSPPFVVTDEEIGLIADVLDGALAASDGCAAASESVPEHV